MPRPRPCLDCGTITTATRCNRCEAAKQRGRNQGRTHYQGDWPALSRKLRAQHVATHGWWCPGRAPPHPHHLAIHPTSDSDKLRKQTLGMGPPPPTPANLDRTTTPPTPNPTSRGGGVETNIRNQPGDPDSADLHTGERASPLPVHGVSQTQYQKGCRCGPCVEFVRSYHRTRRANRVPLSAGSPSHGVSGYQAHGCRCDLCRSAWNDYSRPYRSARRSVLASVESERFEARAVFERDGWRCGICRKQIDQTLKFPHRMAATVDHIVPLSKGGADVEANVQAAHNSCNASKGNRPPADSLRPVG